MYEAWLKEIEGKEISEELIRILDKLCEEDKRQKESLQRKINSLDEELQGKAARISEIKTVMEIQQELEEKRKQFLVNEENLKIVLSEKKRAEGLRSYKQEKERAMKYRLYKKQILEKQRIYLLKL